MEGNFVVVRFLATMPTGFITIHTCAGHVQDITGNLQTAVYGSDVAVPVRPSRFSLSLRFFILRDDLFTFSHNW